MSKVRRIRMEIIEAATPAALESAFNTFRLAAREAEWMESHFTDRGSSLVLIIFYSE